MNTFAQIDNPINSLKLNLNDVDNDLDRARVLNELGLAYRYSNPDSGLFYCEQAIKIAKELEYIKVEVSVMVTMGRIYREQGRLSKSMEILLRANGIAEANEYYQEVAKSNFAIGNIYADLGDHQNAMRHTRIGSNLSAYLSGGLKYYYTNIIGKYYATGKLDSAEIYLEAMKAEFEKSQNMNWNKITLFRAQGYLSEARGEYEKALSYYIQALQSAMEINDIRNTATACYFIATVYKKSDQLDSSLVYAHQGLVYAQEVRHVQRIYQLSLLLSETYELKKDIQQAYKYHKIMVEAKDKVFGVENIQDIQVLIAKEEERQNELSAAEEAFQNRLWMNALLGSTFILVVIAFFLYRNNRQKHKANQKIENAYSELENTQTQLIHSEKMASLGELTAGIAHEIQNPLNFVNNFSEVSSELIEEMNEEIAAGNLDYIKDISDDLKQNLEKINNHGQRASSIVKGMLEHSRTGDGKKVPTDINKLADEYLRLSYHGLRAKDKSFNADFKMDLEPNLPRLNVVPQDFGRVMLNLINNAFQAVSSEAAAKGDSSYKPIVEVITKLVKNRVEIRVKDNGTGIPENIKDKIFEPFFTTKPTGQGTGLGLSMSFDIITKGHGGELKVDSKDGEGTAFIISLPYN